LFEDTSMRTLFVGLVLATGLAGAAAAADYVVVASTDPGVKPGTEVTAGQRLALGAGKTASLIAAAGDVTTLKGGPSGAIAPRLRTASADSARLETVKLLVAPASGGRTFGGRRAGVCPEATTLKTLDDIIAAQQGGCTAEAKQALDALAAGKP
jgi:hypothetical protein